MELLFNKTLDDIQGPASHNHNAFEYYEKSNRKDIQIIRELLNQWFSNYPKEHQKELKSSFKNHFDDSFYELFLHQLFIEVGYNIEIHPKLNNSHKRPDFLIKKGIKKFTLKRKSPLGNQTKKGLLKE